MRREITEITVLSSEQNNLRLFMLTEICRNFYIMEKVNYNNPVDIRINKHVD